MKKIFFLLLIATTICNPVIVKMPGQDELQELLTNNGFEDFANKTAFVSEFGDLEADADTIACGLVTSMHGYFETLEHDKSNEDTKGVQRIFLGNSTRILKLLFQDNPAAIKELQLDKLDQH